MRKFIIGLIFLVSQSIWAASQASTIVHIGQEITVAVPEGGVVLLDGPVAYQQGFFTFAGPYPTLSGRGYAEMRLFASVNGEDLMVFNISYGCSLVVSFCGHGGPITVSNVMPAHYGGGYSTFQTDGNAELQITSGWSVYVYESSISNPIMAPSDYQVQIRVTLPSGVAAIPEPSTWAMMIVGFAGMGLAAHIQRRRRSVPCQVHQAV